MSDNKSLLTIESDIKNLFRVIEDQEGLILPEQEELLKELLTSKESKVSSYVHILDKIDHEKEFVKAQIKKARDYIQKLEATQGKLLDIAKNVITDNKASLTGDMGNLIYLRKSKSVELLIDPNDVPIEYCRTKTEPDLTKIKKAIESGESIDFAVIKESESVNWK